MLHMWCCTSLAALLPAEALSMFTPNSLVIMAAIKSSEFPCKKLLESKQDLCSPGICLIDLLV